MKKNGKSWSFLRGDKTIWACFVHGRLVLTPSFCNLSFPLFSICENWENILSLGFWYHSCFFVSYEKKSHWEWLCEHHICIVFSVLWDVVYIDLGTQPHFSHHHSCPGIAINSLLAGLPTFLAYRSIVCFSIVAQVIPSKSESTLL